MNAPLSYAATAENFSTLVLENSRRGLVVLYAWADYAGPCHKFAPVLARLAQTLRPRFLLVTLDTEAQRRLAREIGINSIPTLKFYRHGEVVTSFYGPQAETDLHKALQAYLPGMLDPYHEAALEAWQDGRSEAALDALIQAQRMRPQDPRIPLQAARWLLRLGRPLDALRMLQALPTALQAQPEITLLLPHVELLVLSTEAPADTDPAALAAQRAGGYLRADDYPAALAELAELARLAPTYRRDLGRRALRALVVLLGHEHPAIQPYRIWWVEE